MMASIKSPPDDRPRAVRSELDELTLARAQRGDQAACRALYHRYKDAVFALHWRMAGSRASQAAIDDLTQETFVQVFSSLAGFSPSGPAKLSTWILVIANRVRGWQLQRLNRVSAEVEAPTCAPDATAGERRRALRAALIRALEAIEPEQRLVVLLRDFHDLEYDEIAQVTDVPVGTVRSRLSRARAALRVALVEWS